MLLSVLQKEEKNKVWLTFAIGTLVAMAAFLPYIIYDGGLFLYYGDFNVQQIPFYQLANEAVRTGNVFWNWGTDLGANFIGSYSFYLLFSPYFWLTLIFPPEATPYLMAPLLALKIGSASATAYLYMKRFVKDSNFAVLGALLYAFSGYSAYNIFFNHFHEALICFPLLLIGLEIAVKEKKYGYFALAITLNAVVNYWFFIGEVVFVAIYFLARFSDKSWRLTLKTFVALCAEAVLGMGLAMVAFLPAVLAITGNPRAGENTTLLGNYLWYYSDPQRYLGIIHSIFMTPDMPALNNWFPDHGAQWSSLSAYIPMFSISMVIAYFATAKKDWLKRMIGISAVMAFVPMLNHAFVALNHSYYARWFYMPTLLMALATVKTLEDDSKKNKINIWNGLIYTGIGIVILTVISGLTPFMEDGELSFGGYKYLDKFLATLAITVIGFVMVVVVMYNRDSEKYKKNLTMLVVVGSFVYLFSTLLIGKATYNNNTWIKEVALPGRDEMSLSEEGVFERSDIYEADDNLGIYWNIPNIQAFHSIVPPSVMEFYPEVGVKRDVSSKPSVEYPQLRSLLSVRWLYIHEDKEEQSPMEGYVFVENRNSYNIYENQNYIPMGFAYESYFTDEQLNVLSSASKQEVMLNSVHLEGDAIERNQDLLEYNDSTSLTDLIASNSFGANAAIRAQMSCDSFTVTKTGFVATSSYDSEQFVFFSVPYDDGWTAMVNGEPVIIEKANIGFMAVRVPEGEAEIVFTYLAPGLKTGVFITIGSIVLFAIYIFVMKAHDKHQSTALFTEIVIEQNDEESISEQIAEQEIEQNGEEI